MPTLQQFPEDNRAAIEGRLTSNGSGTFSNADGDVNAYGTDYPMTFSEASYAVSNAATGRGTMHFAFTFGGTPGTLNFVTYIVNAGKFFAMESDVVSTATLLLNRAVVQQQTPSGGFTNPSLSGNMVIYLTGLSACGSGSEVPKAVAGLLLHNPLDFRNYWPRRTASHCGAGRGSDTIAYLLVARKA